MAVEPIPSLEFGSHHLLGMNLVGTVAIPSPFPATAKIFVVRYPVPSAAKPGEVNHKFFLKIVETINPSHVITRIVDPEQVRAIKWFPKPAAAGAVVEPAIKTGDQLRAEVAGLNWSKAGKDPLSSYEQPLHPEETAVVYVHETTPVLLRHEQTVPAAVSLAASPAMLAAACPHGK
jgi:hypothetical protein